MNAGRDVERLITTWLVEEAPARAPDRVLGEAAAQIDRTKQRRFAAAWREPVSISMRWLAIAAALFVVAVVGAGFIGRSTASVGNQSSPLPVATPTPSPTAHVATLQEYRAARDAICTDALVGRAALEARVVLVGGEFYTDPMKPENMQQLRDMAVFIRDLASRLDALEVPPAMAGDEGESIARYEDTVAIIEQIIPLAEQGKIEEAKTADLATEPLSRGIGSFETKYGLKHCP